MSEDPPPPAPRSRAAWLRGGVAAVVIALVAVLAYRFGRHDARVATDPSAPNGRGAVSVPPAPALPTQDRGGVHLTGVVVDGAGLPVAGAIVSAEPERGVIDRALVGTPPRDAGVSAPSDAAATAAAPNDAGATGDVITAQATGADGRFAIVPLAPGRYRLHVTGVGLLAAEVRMVPVPSDEARIVVARQVAIDGTVTDGGAPVARANVGIRGEAIGGTLEVQTDARGAFHVPNLPEGRYQVYAWQAATAARSVRVNRLGAGPFPPLELRLEAAAIVVGKVVDRDGGAGLAAAVELRPSGDDQAPRYVRSGDDGVFRIEGVPNGRWIADAFVPGFVSPGGVELEAGRGVPELALVRGGAIEGRVLDGDGRPVAGANVRALVGAAPDQVEVSADVDRDRLRRFSGRTAAPAPEQAVGGDPELVARGELGVLLGPIPPVPAPGAELARPSSVVDPNAANASQGLLGEPPPLPSDAAHASIWVTGSDGRFRVGGLGKGKTTALAAAAGFAEARSHTVTLELGQVVTGVDIVLSAGAYVVGHVTDSRGVPVVGAELAAQPEVGMPLEGFSDGDGAYRLGPLVGSVHLRASAYGHGAVERELDIPAARGTVPAEQREDLVLPLADATLAGTLEDDTGAPVAGAHLEVVAAGGDERRAVVGNDGTFAIEMLPAGHVRVRVDHPAFPPSELDAVASTNVEHVHLRLPIGGAVEGVLLDATSGEPLAGTTFTAAGPAGASAEATTDTAGRWKLGPIRSGHWRLELHQPGYLAQTRDLDVPAARAPGATTVRDVRVDLARGGLVGGTVRDGRGQRVARAHVSVRLADGSGPPVTGDADASGEFRLRDCPSGDIVVVATSGDASGQVTASVRPGEEVLGLVVEVK
jgi:hypothetical protein